ncbi:MAG: sugar ABC transporter permease, partial [Acidimicrobiales bacterium]
MKTQSAPSPTPTIDREDLRLLVGAQGVRGTLAHAISRVRNGDIGSLPIIIGIVVVWVLFGVANPVFL